MEQLTFLSAEPPANPSQSQENASDWMTRAATLRSNMFAWLNELMLSGWSSRTSPVFYQAPPETTLPLSSAPLPGMNTDLPPPDGATLALPNASPADGASRGVYLTLNISEWPKDAAVCSLSDIVETGELPQRYYLSPKACAGILRRAEKRHRQLPHLLQAALERAALTIIKPKPDILYPTDSEEETASVRSTLRPV